MQEYNKRGLNPFLDEFDLLNLNSNELDFKNNRDNVLKLNIDFYFGELHASNWYFITADSKKSRNSSRFQHNRKSHG